MTEENLRETGKAKIKKVGYGGGGVSLQEEREGEGREKEYGGRASRRQGFSIHDYGSTLGTNPEYI